MHTYSTRTTSTTDPDAGMFVKGEHERQFAYEAHTACDKNGFVVGVEVTAGNVHDSVAWDGLWRIPIMPYTRHRGLDRVTNWVRLGYACMNLKSWRIGVGDTPFPTLSTP